MNNNKKAKYRKIFAKQRKARWIALSCATSLIKANPDAEFADGILTSILNRAAPVAIDLGQGWINCLRFGMVADGLISYRPVQRRQDCTALVSGLRLNAIKQIKII